MHLEHYRGNAVTTIESPTSRAVVGAVAAGALGLATLATRRLLSRRARRRAEQEALAAQTPLYTMTTFSVTVIERYTGRNQ